ncbi:MAG: sterol desaturase family protein [Planctomycetota bacterium]
MASDDGIESPAARRFGTGWIAGTLSVALGIVGLLAVACFHFPSYLTMPDVRHLYPLVWVRLLLHVILVAAFLAGCTSFVLRSDKTLGVVGMALALVAALLGGSRVPIDGPTTTGVYLGLDYVLLLFVLYSLIFIPMERVFGRLPQRVFRKDWKLDLAYFFISTLLVQVTTFLTVAPAALLFGWAQGGTVQQWVKAQPTALQFLELVVIVDLAQYWIHRAFHVIPWLWRFHAIHHSTEVLDWMSGNRQHIVDAALTRGLIYIPAFALGFDELPMILYVVLVSVQSVFIHANVNFRFGRLSYLFATPHFHHWHHGVDREAVDKNFAIHLPVLDMLFGTFHLPLERWPRGYGVVPNDVPPGYFAQWAYPFLPKPARQPSALAKSDTPAPPPA